MAVHGLPDLIVSPWYDNLRQCDSPTTVKRDLTTIRKMIAQTMPGIQEPSPNSE